SDIRYHSERGPRTQGYDLATAARRLRIRPDILRAIEEDDFSRMPPRGYARNMVNAYARLVGLNPTEMTRMYLDEAYAYQVGRARNDAQPSGFDMGGTSRTARSFDMGGTSRTARSSTRQRGSGAQQADERPPAPECARPHDVRRSTRLRARLRHAQRRGGAPLFRGPHASQPPCGAAERRVHELLRRAEGSSVVQSKLPFIIAGGVILVLLIVVLVLVFGGKGGDANDDVTKMPVTGLADTTQGESGTDGTDSAQPQTAPVETAPTSVKVTYKIAKNTDVYAVITKNGESEDKMFSGGEEDTVELEADGVWTFAAWASDGVTITVDGEDVAFDGVDATGMPMAEVDFNDYLEKWYEAHPDAKKPAGSGTSDAGTGASDGGTDGTGDGTAT
ncbi:helix-turn-helix domain-containing protein, partial [Eggerthella sinensis]|uniref:helix-turn-helix domain-containing protein n=1 Tax=Eggerthella sinensis TaxID=242230 RepID=UPI0022E11543